MMPKVSGSSVAHMILTYVAVSLQFHHLFLAYQLIHVNMSVAYW